MKNMRMQKLVKVHSPDFPDEPIGTGDVIELLGISPENLRHTVYRGMPCCGYDMEIIGTVEMYKGRKCVRCGAEIDNVRSTVYCDKCRRDNWEIGQERKRIRLAHRGSKRKLRKEVPYEEKSPLSRKAWDARQHGMSYGGYMTYLTARWFK